jgi:hypothetical protein
MRESGFCTWLALTWNCESRVGIADFAYLETSLGMRGYELESGVCWKVARVDCASGLIRGYVCVSLGRTGVTLSAGLSVAC